MKQTAVEFYRKELNAFAFLGETKFNSEQEIFKQAKEMEKEQIFDSWENGFREFYDGSSTPEQYYKETYEEK